MELSVQGNYFSLIKSGKKCVEGRLSKPKFSSLSIGDILIFKNSQNIHETIATRVKFINRYSSFKEMLQKEGLEKCLPGCSSLEEGIAIYHSFPNYENGEKSYGVLAIEFELPQS